jgi:hypothetical protein
MPIIRAGINGDQPFFGDASFRTAYLRKQANLGVQAGKIIQYNQEEKPSFVSGHLKQGFTNGVKDVFIMKNRASFI